MRIALYPQHHVGVAAHLRNLVGAHAILLQQAPRGVGAIRRELPIAVVGVGRVLRGVGVPLDQQFIGQGLQFPGQQPKEFLANVADMRAAALIKGAVLVLDQFDAQAFRSDGDLDLLGEFFKFLLSSKSLFN